MNNEIKEILDKLNEDKDYDDYVDYKGSYFKPLLDYITNLQEENKVLKENAEHNDKVVDKAKWNEMIYKSIIDKAIEFIEMYNVYFNDNLDKKSRPYIPKELLNILKGEDK